MVYVVGHRGAMALMPENTLKGFRYAIELGVDYVECDVHLSRDGQLVVMHDTTVDRTTNGHGAIRDLAFARLRSLDAGDGEQVPTLDEVLETVRHEVHLLIELKGSEGHDEGLVVRVAECLDGYPGKAAIMSFEHRLIRRFAIEAPGIPGGLTAHGRTPADLEAHFSMLAHPISFVSFSVIDLPNRFVVTARQKFGLPVITWTVRDEWAVNLTRDHADQMTFEGFDPDALGTSSTET